MYPLNLDVAFNTGRHRCGPIHRFIFLTPFRHNTAKKCRVRINQQSSERGEATGPVFSFLKMGLRLLILVMNEQETRKIWYFPAKLN
jgi:hypothetical protein